jgi:hypothetical protein
MSIEIKAADPRGVPTTVSCSCGEQWQRPDDDPEGRTLPDWVRIHHRNGYRYRRILDLRT